MITYNVMGHDSFNSSTSLFSVTYWVKIRIKVRNPTLTILIKILCHVTTYLSTLVATKHCYPTSHNPTNKGIEETVGAAAAPTLVPTSLPVPSALPTALIQASLFLISVILAASSWLKPDGESIQDLWLETGPPWLVLPLSLIHIWRCRRSTLCRSRWSPYH